VREEYNMRNFTNSSSTTTVIRGVNGCFVGAISVLRSFLCLTFMRESLGYWQETGHQIQASTCHHGKSSLDKRLGRLAQQLWLIATPASQLAPATAIAVRLENVRYPLG
jgi:hypothetical protein